MNDGIVLAEGDLEAEIALLGAELIHLRHKRLGEFMWSRDARYWGYSSPILFPIIGQLREGHFRIGETRYEMPAQGFARRTAFELIEKTPTHCRLELRDSPASLAQYPYPFRLLLDYTLQGSAIDIRVTVDNPGQQPLPFSLGFHPGFRWPLEPGIPRQAHYLEFDQDTELSFSRTDKRQLLCDDVEHLPLPGHRLALSDEVLAKGALIMRSLTSTRMRFGSTQGAVALDLLFEGLPQFAIWALPDAQFLCLEPWRGHPTPADFTGDFREKPGSLLLPPGDTMTFRMQAAIAG